MPPITNIQTICKGITAGHTPPRLALAMKMQVTSGMAERTERKMLCLRGHGCMGGVPVSPFSVQTPLDCAVFIYSGLHSRTIPETPEGRLAIQMPKRFTALSQQPYFPEWLEHHRSHASSWHAAWQSHDFKAIFPMKEKQDWLWAQ